MTINKKVCFYDTNALLELQEEAFKEFFVISSITLTELEDIKTSSKKDESTKYKVRKALHLLDANCGKYEVIIYNCDIKNLLLRKGLELTPDNEVIACCEYLRSQGNDLLFVTNDIACKMIASKVFQLDVESIGEMSQDDYRGYKEVCLPENEMANFYEHLNENTLDLLTCEYLLLKTEDGEIVDILVWKNGCYQNVKFPNIKSDYFGIVKPYHGDVYQQMALNSFSTNQITMIKGRAGTGKSFLALGYLMYLLDKKKIDKVIIFCNTVATVNSAKLGYLPGSKDEKLLDSSIGNMLSAKLGDSFGLEQMIVQGKIQLLPMSDIRGFDTTGMNAGIYITEAQNMDISLMKLALQRIGDDSICIIDGDYNAQCDMAQYSGSNNGMRRMSSVFRGQDFYGEVELKNIYRSKIAEIADKM